MRKFPDNEQLQEIGAGPTKARPGMKKQYDDAMAALNKPDPPAQGAPLADRQLYHAQIRAWLRAQSVAARKFGMPDEAGLRAEKAAGFYPFLYGVRPGIIGAWMPTPTNSAAPFGVPNNWKVPKVPAPPAPKPKP